MVQKKYNRFVSLFLNIFVLVLLICFEHSRSLVSFALLDEQQLKTDRVFSDTNVMRSGFCTTEMLDTEAGTGSLQMTGQGESQAGEIEFATDLYLQIFSYFNHKFFLRSRIAPFLNFCHRELITTYLHKSDGKK